MDELLRMIDDVDKLELLEQYFLPGFTFVKVIQSSVDMSLDNLVFICIMGRFLTSLVDSIKEHFSFIEKMFLTTPFYTLIFTLIIAFILAKILKSVKDFFSEEDKNL